MFKFSLPDKNILGIPNADRYSILSSPNFLMISLAAKQIIFNQALKQTTITYTTT